MLPAPAWTLRLRRSPFPFFALPEHERDPARLARCFSWAHRSEPLVTATRTGFVKVLRKDSSADIDARLAGAQRITQSRQERHESINRIFVLLFLKLFAAWAESRVDAHHSQHGIR